MRRKIRGKGEYRREGAGESTWGFRSFKKGVLGAVSGPLNVRRKARKNFRLSFLENRLFIGPVGRADSWNRKQGAKVTQHYVVFAMCFGEIR